MDGKRILILLARRAAGEISAEESAELDHLLTNHPDTVYYDEFIQELWKTPQEEEPDTDRFFDWHKRRHGKALSFEEESLTSSFSADLNRRSWRFSKKRQWVLYGLVLLTGMVGLWWFTGRGTKLPHDRVEIVAEKGVRKQFELPDGTKVWLNADSRLWYNSQMKSNTERTVELQGEAYFDVAKDSKRPFSISTEKISIRVLGTAFNVKAYPEDSKTEATLIAGAIELLVKDRPYEKIRMKPNEKIAVTNKPEPTQSMEGEPAGKALTLTIGSISKVQVADVEYIQETSWVNNKLVFRNETLAELIPKIERWYNVDIHVTNPKVMGYRYTSTITEEDDIHQLLEALQFIHSFNYKIESHDVTIY